MAKQLQPTIPVPASFVHRIAAVGRLLTILADDLQVHHSGALVQRKPRNVPKDQEWYWSKQWQEWERQADEELARGEFKEFDSVEELIADLHSHT